MTCLTMCIKHNSLFINPPFSLLSRLGTFQFDSSSSRQHEVGELGETGGEELFVNMSNGGVDGATSTTDQLLLSRQDFYCGGKTFQQIISQHPDISRGSTSIKYFKTILHRTIKIESLE